MRKIHTVTKENARKLQDGDSFKNFGALFRALTNSSENDRPVGGNSKIQFLADLDRFVEFKKDGYVYTIISIRPDSEIKPPRPAPGTSKYTLMLENMIAYQLIQECNMHDEDKIELFWNPYDIFFSCGMTNESFRDYSRQFHDIDSEMEIKAKLFKYNAKAAMEGYVKSAFKAMARNKEIIWKVEPVVFFRRSPRELHLPTKEEYTRYLKMTTRIIESFQNGNGQQCESEREIFFNGRSEEYYRKLRKEIFKEFGYDNAYPMYHIITETSSLHRAMKRIEKISPSEEYIKVNNAMCDGVFKLKSLRCGRMMSEINPDFENTVWGKQPEFLYDVKILDDDSLIRHFIEETMRINIDIWDDDDVPNATFEIENRKKVEYNEF